MAGTFGSDKAKHGQDDASATQANPLWVSAWQKGDPQSHPGSGTTSHREQAPATDRSRIVTLLAGTPADDDETAPCNVSATRLTAFSRPASTADVLQRDSYVMASLRRSVKESALQAHLATDLAARRRRLRRPTPWAQTIGRLCGLGLLWGAANSIDL